jgi:hypothetical protein
VHHQEHEPQPHHEALLSHEGPIADLEHPRHEGVAFTAASLEPEQGEERIEDVEHEDDNEQRHVASLEGIDIDVRLLPGSAPAPAPSQPREGGPYGGRPTATIGMPAALAATPLIRPAVGVAVRRGSLMLAGLLRRALLQLGWLRAARPGRAP